MTIKDMAYMNSATTGTGTLQLGSAQSGYQTFAAAGAANNGIYSYGIIDAGTTWEVGQGTYVTNSSGNFWARTTVNYSSSGTSAINCTGAEVIYLTMLEYDYLTTPPFSFGGRLTLATGLPVLTANVYSAQTTIFYTPYNNGYVPIYDGTRFNSIPFSEISIVLDVTNVVNNGVYDCFLWNNAGTAVLGYGPAWTSTTTRSATGITLVNGIQVCNSAITLRSNSSVTNAISINQATYVGSFYGTAAGVTAMQFFIKATGGGNNTLGLFNAYNQVLVSASSCDNTASWSYSTATWRHADNNAKNTVRYIDGLGISTPFASYICGMNAVDQDGNMGIGLNWSSGAPLLCTFSDVSAMMTQSVEGLFSNPVMGLNTLSAIETCSSPATNVLSFTGTGGAVQTQALRAEVMM